MLDLGDDDATVDCLEMTAGLAMALDRTADVVRLAAAANRTRRIDRSPSRQGRIRRCLEHHLSEARTRLGDDGFGEAWSEGETLDIGAAVQLGIQVAEEPG